ncbi:hypothetical protein [Microvirga sp. Mcv34]|uniref:hypothetical protein n=1 Tax=Microvirga sp. Mcv34 TaxID=2926016 RepID=UPI0021C66344|nr:hypothetical protein [Microvirga sp. Mcv34]
MGREPAKLIADDSSFRCDDLVAMPLQGDAFLFEIQGGHVAEILSAECAQALAIWILMRSGAEISSLEATDGNIRVRFLNGKRPGS